MKRLLAFLLFVVACHAQYQCEHAADQICIVGQLSSAQVLALNSSPVTVLKAPGSGVGIQVDHVTIKLAAGSSPYTFSGTVGFQYHQSVSAVGNSCASGILTATPPGQVCFMSPTVALVSLSAFFNRALDIAASSAPTGGNGTLNYWVRYHFVYDF